MVTQDHLQIKFLKGDFLNHKIYLPIFISKNCNLFFFNIKPMRSYFAICFTKWWVGLFTKLKIWIVGKNVSCRKFSQGLSRKHETHVAEFQSLTRRLHRIWWKIRGSWSPVTPHGQIQSICKHGQLAYIFMCECISKYALLKYTFFQKDDFCYQIKNQHSSGFSKRQWILLNNR